MEPVTELTNQKLDTATKSILFREHFEQSPDSENTKNAINGVLTDEYGLPFEPEEYYNSAPLQFEEMAQSLWILTNNIHYAATRYNRHSPTYMTLQINLEKNIRQLGSVCITKALLEKSGENFLKLDRISLHELYCMVSLHFRKCFSAYQDLQNNEQALDLNLINRIFSWAALAERLKATEDKIQKIKDGKIKIETMLDRAQVYNKEPDMRKDQSGSIVNPKLRTSALPIMKSFAKKIKEQKSAEEKQEKSQQREAERASKRLEKSGILNSETYNFPPYQAKPLPKIPGLGLTEKELKQFLMDEAKSRGNLTEAGIIAAESFEQHLERFKKMKREGKLSQQYALPDDCKNNCQQRYGPSNETRKKLREKRKKRK